MVANNDNGINHKRQEEDMMSQARRNTIATSCDASNTNVPKDTNSTVIEKINLNRNKVENGRSRNRHSLKTKSTTKTTASSIKHIPFYTLCNILSYLSESEGVRVLLTNKIYYFMILPQFELPSSKLLPWIKTRRHFHFRTSPIIDAETLLARLNSRRLFQRRMRSSVDSASYSISMTTVDISKKEWRLFEQLHNDGIGTNDQNTIVTKIPPHLNLLRFEKSSVNAGVTLLASYPRSGNSLLRSLFELITCRVTGSDTRPDRTLSKELALKYNMVGEGVTSATKTPLVKTHFPERRGMAPFPASRTILLVRNPCDAIHSYFHMTLTNTHTQTVTEDVYQSYFDLWEDMCMHEMQIWADFHQFWLQKKEQLPVLIIRYEDLLRYPKEVMSQVLPFVFNHSDHDNEFWQGRMNYIFDGDDNQFLHRIGSYKPRSGTIGASFSKFSLQLRQSMLQSIPSSLNIFDQLGYSSFSQWMQNDDSSNIWKPLPNFCMTFKPNDNVSSSVIVNNGKELRDLNHPYGRNMTAWRKSQTHNDENPFSTVNEN